MTLQIKPSTSNSKIKKILAHNDFKPNTRNNKNIHKEIDNLLHEIPKQMHKKTDNKKKPQKTEKIQPELQANIKKEKNHEIKN